MLLSFWKALSVNCPPQKQVAADVGVTHGCFHQYSRGDLFVRPLRRPSLDRAMGPDAAIDWVQYEAEFYAKNPPDTQQPAPPAPSPDFITPEPPKTTNAAPVAPVSAPTPEKSSESWFDGVIFGNDEGQAA